MCSSSHAIGGNFRLAMSIFAALALLSSPATSLAQEDPSHASDRTTIAGTIRNSAGDPVAGASVLLQHGNSDPIEAITKADGSFMFPALLVSVYSLRANKSGIGTAAIDSLAPAAGEKKHVNLVLKVGAAAGDGGAMQLDDKPSFVVAGVADWSGAGGHGSDASLRTGEGLAKETLALKSAAPKDGSPESSDSAGTGVGTVASESSLRAALVQAPGSFETNHQLGEFYLYSKRYREAVPLLEAAYRINPFNDGNAYNLALAYEGTGDFGRAREQVQKMFAHEDKADWHHLLGDLAEQLKR